MLVLGINTAVANTEGTWIHLGIPMFNTATANPNLAIGRFGTPYVAYNDNEYSYHTSVISFHRKI